MESSIRQNSTPLVHKLNQTWKFCSFALKKVVMLISLSKSAVDSTILPTNTYMWFMSFCNTRQDQKYAPWYCMIHHIPSSSLVIFCCTGVIKYCDRIFQASPIWLVKWTFWFISLHFSSMISSSCQNYFVACIIISKGAWGITKHKTHLTDRAGEKRCAVAVTLHV